jgi:hypothetical protein
MPPELAAFCNPHVVRLEPIPYREDCSAEKEIIYGNASCRRNSKCFVFMVDAGTQVVDGPLSPSPLDQEQGRVGVLYGMSVLHPRLVKLDSEAMPFTGDEVEEEEASPGPEPASPLRYYQTTVSYTFISKYPFFEFFFQVIFDLLSSERLARMEALSPLEAEEMFHNDEMLPFSFLPVPLLQEAMLRLAQVPIILLILLSIVFCTLSLVPSLFLFPFPLFFLSPAKTASNELKSTQCNSTQIIRSTIHGCSHHTNTNTTDARALLRGQIWLPGFNSDPSALLLA